MAPGKKILRATLRQKVALTLVGLLLVAVAIGGLGLTSSLRTRELYEDLGAEQLVQARAIYEVELVVLELGHRMTTRLAERAEVTEATEGPNPEVTFERWLGKLGQTELEPDQRRLLPEIAAAFRAYLSLWPRVLEHRPSAQSDDELRQLMAELTAAHERARGLCQRLRKANERDLREALAAERQQALYVTYWIVAFSALLVGLALVVGWLFWYRTLVPLRRITGNVRSGAPGVGHARGADDLAELEEGVTDLGSEVARLRVRLSHSDRHLIEADKLATMGRVAAGVAHEIRSPLTALRLRLFSLQRRIESLDAAQSGNVAVMVEEVHRLDGIVSSFLELSRPPRVSPRPCSLSLLVEKTLEVLRHRIEGSELGIQMAEEADMPPVLADPPQLRQVIMNLVNNAIEAGPAGTCIRIEVLRDPGAPEPPLALLRIADNGGGVPEEVRETLFDPFSSTKAEGSGLGLWIARSIAIRHGGSLVLERTSKVETSFALRIPLAPGRGHGPHPGD